MQAGIREYEGVGVEEGDRDRGQKLLFFRQNFRKNSGLLAPPVGLANRWWGADGYYRLHEDGL